MCVTNCTDPSPIPFSLFPSCLHIEKKYIEDIAPTVPQIPLTDICWGHVLMHTHETFTAPEEWEYALRTAVLPKLDNALVCIRVCCDMFYAVVYAVFPIIRYA